MKLHDIRAIAKVRLANTFLYNFAKHFYVSYKNIVDKKAFLKQYPDAQYIEYSLKEIIKQHENGGYFSQYGQDYFLWENFLSPIENGHFVDIGANDPTINSNSYYLEKQGWTGIAIDPVSRFEKLWSKQRTTPFKCGAVSSTEADIEFVEILPKEGWEHALSGFKSCIRKEDSKIYDYIEYTVKAKPLDKYLSNNSHVDLVLIDVEGAELEVLQGINFDDLKPIYVLIENITHLGGNQEIRDYMRKMQYTCIARISATDDLFEYTRPQRS